jgi:hypothetical protein
MAPYIQVVGPSHHVGKYHGTVGDGAIQYNHVAMVAGAVQKGQIMIFLKHSLFCVKLHKKAIFVFFYGSSRDQTVTKDPMIRLKRIYNF